MPRVHLAPDQPTVAPQCACGCQHQVLLSRGRWNTYIQGHNKRKSPIDYVIDLVTGCWIWQRSTAGKYGQCWVQGKNKLAHIHMYELKYGLVPDGLELDHFKCDNTMCCNPDHVKPVSRAQNCQRRSTTKLSQLQVDEIRSSSLTQKELAQQYNLSQGHVSKLKGGKRWEL